MTGLRDHLQSLYPRSALSSSNTSSVLSSGSCMSHMTHIHYRRHNYVVEYTPLMLAYVILCLYLYFSVRESQTYTHTDKQTLGTTAFSALTLLIGRQEGHSACKNWVVGCWHGYLSGVRCRFAYAQLMPLPLTVSCSSKSRFVLPSWFYLSGTGSPGLSWTQSRGP